MFHGEILLVWHILVLSCPDEELWLCVTISFTSSFIGRTVFFDNHYILLFDFMFLRFLWRLFLLLQFGPLFWHIFNQFTAGTITFSFSEDNMTFLFGIGAENNKITYFMYLSKVCQHFYLLYRLSIDMKAGYC